MVQKDQSESEKPDHGQIPSISDRNAEMPNEDDRNTAPNEDDRPGFFRELHASLMKCSTFEQVAVLSSQAENIINRRYVIM